jgi:hypothetical protein
MTRHLTGLNALNARRGSTWKKELNAQPVSNASQAAAKVLGSAMQLETMSAAKIRLTSLCVNLRMQNKKSKMKSNSL